MLDRVFAGLGRLRFLKIDVEGMEIDVLLGGRELILRTRPVLYVENDRPAKSEALVAYLRSLGYDLYWHTPRLYNPDNYSGNRENVFGGTLSINLFAIPSEGTPEDRHRDLATVRLAVQEPPRLCLEIGD